MTVTKYKKEPVYPNEIYDLIEIGLDVSLIVRGYHVGGKKVFALSIEYQGVHREVYIKSSARAKTFSRVSYLRKWSEKYDFNSIVFE